MSSMMRLAALKDFVVNLRLDLPAVQAALNLPWTTNPAEGQTNRLKMLKRTMYGRAGFRLLRARVLHAAYRNHGTEFAGEPNIHCPRQPGFPAVGLALVTSRNISMAAT
jgi:hypothetical protein